MSLWQTVLTAAWLSVIAVNHLPTHDELVLPELIKLEHVPPELLPLDK
jgi:hypothetical protein